MFDQAIYDLNLNNFLITRSKSTYDLIYLWEAFQIDKLS
jgi:hypothetical protein